MLVMTNR